MQDNDYARRGGVSHINGLDYARRDGVPQIKDLLLLGARGVYSSNAGVLLPAEMYRAVTTKSPH